MQQQGRLKSTFSFGAPSPALVVEPKTRALSALIALNNIGSTGNLVIRRPSFVNSQVRSGNEGTRIRLLSSGGERSNTREMEEKN